NVMMAATLAEGETILRNAACEPEIADLADLLVKMGARIQGAGGSTIRIEGVDRLHGAEHVVIPDRIETGTFVAACAMAGGEIEIRNCFPPHLRPVIDKLREIGIRIEEGPDNLRVRAPLTGAEVMATDLRASACLVTAALAAKGETTIDRVYHLDRGYWRIDEKLRGLGADIERIDRGSDSGQRATDRAQIA